MAKRKAVLALNSDATSVPDEKLDGLRRMFPDVDLDCVAFDTSGVGMDPHAEILYSYIITPAMLDAAKSLKWFHSVVTGPDAYAFPALIQSGVKVTSPRGVYSAPMAETALGLMLALARGIRDSIAAQGERRWAASDLYKRAPLPSELSGSTAMIVGLGGVGSEVAKRCKSMGMEVVGVVRSPREKHESVDSQVVFDEVGAWLSRADFIVLACPLTNTTSGMIGNTELDSMKDSAYLINLARGELVDEQALAGALESGSIAGAASDVFATEPLPSDSPLYTAKNMIVLPHVSGFSDRFWDHAIARFAENMERYLEGKPMIGEVDFTRGY